MLRVATITVDAQGRLTEDSTLTIDGVTTLIPAHSGGGWLAPRRIADALAARGYRPATDYYSDLSGPRDGVLTIAVCPDKTPIIDCAIQAYESASDETYSRRALVAAIHRALDLQKEEIARAIETDGGFEYRYEKDYAARIARQYGRQQ